MFVCVYLCVFRFTMKDGCLCSPASVLHVDMLREYGRAERLVLTTEFCLGQVQNELPPLVLGWLNDLDRFPPTTSVRCSVDSREGAKRAGDGERRSSLGNNTLGFAGVCRSNESSSGHWNWKRTREMIRGRLGKRRNCVCRYGGMV
jgi:hypothetical protein